MGMGISVHFLGICTHVWWPGMQPRVVIINATEETPFPEVVIAPHIPKLRIAARDIVAIDTVPWPADSLVLAGTSEAIIEWQLDGVRMSIVNGRTTSAEKDPLRFHCIPSLQSLIDDDLGPPSQAYVEDGDRRLTSCIFDLNCGVVSGGALKEKGAVFSMLRAETNGQPQLRIAAFGSATPKVLTLNDGAEVTITNLGATERSDSPLDFYLHYKLAQTMPPVLKSPTSTGPGCVVNEFSRTWPPGFGSVDAGCSNSGYP